MAVRRHLVALLAVVSLIAGFTIGSASIAGAIPLPSPPGAPTSLVAYRGNGSAEIAFTAGARNYGVITNYKYSTDNGSSWTAFSPAVTTPSVTIGGLTNGTTYSVKLRAVNSAGDGAVSDAVSVTPADVNAINWTGRTPAEANNWQSVAYGNGLFVAVSWNGTNRVMTSPDGITWTARSVPSGEWKAVTFGNGLFVAVADYGTNRVMTSTDGTTWTARTAAATSLWRGLTYGNGLFVAVAWLGTNRVMTSPDGITWTARSAAEANGWKSVTYGNGLFVAVSFNGTNRVMTSTDGITWTARSAAEASSWSKVTYGNGTFVAVANNGDNHLVMTSSNGITWTARSASSDAAWDSLTYGNGNFVAAANTSVMISTDGITWRTRPSAWANWRGIAYGNGTFVAVGETSGQTLNVMTAEFTAPTTPSAPTSLATTIAKGSTSVSFTAGADGGSSITNYEYQLNGTGAWTALSPAATYSPVTIAGLTNGTSYTVKLRAVNDLGAGTASSASASFTPLLRLLTPAQQGTLSIIAGTGSGGYPEPGPATSSPLGTMQGLAVDSAGNVYMADAMLGKVFKISAAGTLSVFAGTGEEFEFSAPPAITPGPATSAALAGPSGVAVDSADNVYLAVAFSRQVVKITPGGTLSIVAGTGTLFDPFGDPPTSPVLVPGPATSVDLNSPTGVAVDSSGNLYILDDQYRQVLKVTTGGTLSVVAGDGSIGAPTAGAATSSALNYPTGIAVDSAGNLYIADSGANQVLKVTSGGTLSIFAGTGSNGLPTPGLATSSDLGWPRSIAVDSVGNVFITDSFSSVIEKITPAGALTVVAGTGYRGTPTAGPVADSELGGTSGVATDSAGNIYIFDDNNYLEKVTFAPLVVVPAAPTDLVATSGDGSALISFTAGADGGAAISKYQYQLGSGSWVDAVGTSSPITISGLSNGTAYTVKLRAVNSAGSGAASVASSSFTPRTVPGAPSITSVNPGDSTVSVEFTAGSTGGSLITGYEYQLNGSGSWFSLGTTSSPASIGVTNGVAYTVKLRAVNVAGSGAASVASGSFTPRTVPGAPSITSVTAGNGSASISFTAGADGGAAISKYQYQLGSGSWVDAVGTSSPITISGLSNGTAYTVKLRAVNSAGSGAASVASSSFTPRTVPGAPSITSVNPGDSTVSVEFTAGSTGGSLITGYEYQLNGSGSWFSLGTTSSPASIGVTNGVAYTVKLRAVNSAGSGAASVASSSFTPRTVPGAPSITSVTAGNGSASISFTAGADGGASITKYQFSIDDGSTWADAVAGTTSPVTIPGLTNFTTYSVKLRAVNSAGGGAASVVSGSFTPRMAGPISCSATALSRRSIQACWSPFTPPVGQLLRTWARVFLAGTDTQVRACVVVGSATSCSVGALKANTAYDVRVLGHVRIAPRQVFWTSYATTQQVTTLP